MRNPYFFVFLGMLSSLLTTFELKAQTTKLSPPVVAGNPLELFEIERPQLPNLSPAESSTASQRKVNVDLSTVPDLGSAQTEAGFAAPGFAPPGFTPQMPAYTPPSYTRAGGPVASESPMNVGMNSVAGVMNLFQMAIQVGQRVNPRASGPLFLGECTDCAEADQESSLEVASARGTPSYYEQIRESHDPDAIRAAINSETAFSPYEGLEEGLQQSYINSTILALDQSGAYVLHNSTELTGLCPSFEALNISQKKAVMVFVLSEIFKQTSNHNASLVRPVTIAGRSTNRVGLCQIEYQETQQFYESLQQTLRHDENTFNTQFATTPGYNLDICVSLLMRDRASNPSRTYSPLRSRFPDVDFTRVNSRIRSLNMCQSN